MDYCRNDTDSKLEELIIDEVLSNLRRFDIRTYENKPQMAKARKRLVFGAVETCRALELGKLKGVVVARNLSSDALLGIDFRACIENKIVPVIYCGKRRQLGGALLSPKALIGIVGVLKIDGVEQAWNEALVHWSKLRESWLDKSSSDISNIWGCAFFGHTELLKRIYEKVPFEKLQEVVNIGNLTIQGKTMLIVATERDNVDVMEFLINELEADDDIPDFTLSLPVHDVKSAEAASLLKYRKKNNAAGKTAIEVAIENERLDALDYFIKQTDSFSDTSKLLFAAVRCKTSSSIAFLVKKFKIVDIETFINEKGNDLIMEAAQSGSYEVFKYLLSLNYRINYDLKNNSGIRIVEIAERTKNEGIARYIAKHTSK